MDMLVSSPRLLNLPCVIAASDNIRSTLKKRQADAFTLSTALTNELNNTQSLSSCLQTQNHERAQKRMKCAGPSLALVQTPPSSPEKKVPPPRPLSPDEIIREAFKCNGYSNELKPTNKQSNFENPTNEQIAAYDHDILKAARSNDVDTLRTLHKSGRNLQCRNQFGESLIHMSCRRGYTAMVEYLIKEVNVCVQVRDDYGRTPVHDACWAAKPNFAILDLLIQKVPEHLLLTDVRGFTPFAYVRKEDTDTWKTFLNDRKTMLRPQAVTTGYTNKS